MAKNLRIVDNDELAPLGEPEQSGGIADLVAGGDGYGDSDDDLPVIVNAEEFMREQLASRSAAAARDSSPSPPRKTVDRRTGNTGAGGDSDDEVVYRDRAGRRITRDAWLLLNQVNGINWQTKKKEKREAQQLVWGKGLVQKAEEAERAEEDAKAAEQPFQRYDIDAGYDSELRRRSRREDPVADFARVGADFGTSGGPAAVEAHERPKSRFAAVPNRFDIPPGYRWDGVVRGNGYERRWFEQRAAERARESAAYARGVADL